MTHTQAIKSPSTNDKPKAIGFVRNDVSGLHAPRHANDVQRHARTLGYHYVYTVRPPADVDPIGYALGIAAGLGMGLPRVRLTRGCGLSGRERGPVYCLVLDRGEF
ncbi:hypothetical protein, partial [Nocardia sp. NPDC051463]|uniref:hypothetical protein n=1 Tax=Nocardia sp. NPDC051463 TaxID=3154845 RepID=UPI00344C04F3